MVELLVRSGRAVMHFVPQGGEQFRQLLAAITVWQQQASGSSIAVDTQTTEEGTGGGPGTSRQMGSTAECRAVDGEHPLIGDVPDGSKPGGRPIRADGRRPAPRLGGV